MAVYTQDHRFFKIHTPLGADELLLAGFRGREAISELFCFEAQLAAAHDADIPFQKIIGQNVTIEIELAGRIKRHVNGIVNSFAETGRDDHLTYFHARIVPRFWLWTQRVHSRIFQQKTVPAILEEVFEGLRPHVRLALTGNYLARNYCTQYQESDFAFASRVMEEEGIYYFFEHREAHHTLIVTDALAGCPELPAGAKVAFERVGGGTHEHTRVHEWQRRLDIKSTTYTLRDYQFELPTQDLQAQLRLRHQAKVGKITQDIALKEPSLENNIYPGGYAKWSDGVNPDGEDQSAQLQNIFEQGAKQAKLRSEEAAAQALSLSGAGDCGQFTAGHRFELHRHHNADGAYLLVSVDHDIEPDYHFRSSETGTLQYRNRFTALPESIEYRPARATPAPVIAGPQTAFVVGPEGEEIFVDKYGRIKVRFHWDPHGQFSCWLRVGQIWAGNSWGAFFWPRVGNEVVVAFEEGDPDRPLVVGSVYNAMNMPPVTLPGENMTGGIKSCVFTKNPMKEFNGVFFVDAPGGPYVHTHSAQTEMQNSTLNRVHFVPQAHYKFNGSFPPLGG